MRKFICAVVCFCLSSLLPAWVKQGTVTGNIADVEVISWDGNNGLVYVATRGAGIWKTTDGQNWTEANGSGSGVLPDLAIKAICAEPDPSTGYPNANALLAISDSRVYRTANQGATWSAWSVSSQPADVRYMDIAAADGGTLVHYHLATYGKGTYRKIGSSGNWVSTNDGNMFDNSDLYCLCIAANGTKAVVGTEYRSGNTGHLYTRDFAEVDAWATYTPTWFPQNVSVRALAFRHSSYAFAALDTGAIGGPGGLWWSPGGTGFPNFTQLTGSGTMPDGRFLSVDYYYDPMMSGDFFGVAGTEHGLWHLPDPAMTGAQYEAIPFVGSVTGVGVSDPSACTVFFGGPGKGPFRSGCPFTDRPYPIRDGLHDYQAVDLAPGRYCGTGGDYDLFAASGIAGLWKNQKEFDADTGAPGYFTRMIGDTTSDGVPEVTCVGVSNNYRKWNGATGGDINSHQLTVFVGTNGKGVLKSVDGGRSWFNPNTGTDILPLGKRISALAVSPNYATDQDLFAAIYDGTTGGYGGVWRSLDGGVNWSLLGSTSLLNKSVTTLALSPTYSGGTGNVYAGCKYDGTNNTVWRFTGSAWGAVGSPFTYNVTSLAVPSTHLFAGTEANGVWYHNSDFWASYNTGLPNGSQYIAQIEAAPDWSVTGALLIAVRPLGTSSYPGGVYWYLNGTGWQAFTSGLPDTRVLSVAFSPDFAANDRIFCGHALHGVYTAVLDPIGGPGSNWVGGSGFYTTPERVNGVAIDPADPNIVMASTRDMGVFLSLDGGYTFRPWSKGLTYTAGTTVVRVMDVTLSSLITSPVSGTMRRALCGTADRGIYYANFDPESATPTPDLYYARWFKAAMGTTYTPTPGDINEIRSLGEGFSLLSETFEGTVPPPGWTRTNTLGTGTWSSNPWKYCAPAPVTSPLSGGVALMDNVCSDTIGAQRDYLVSPALDTQGVGNLTLEFDHQYWDATTAGVSNANVHVYRPSNNTWYTVATYNSTTPAQHRIYDLTSYIESGMQIRFYYQCSVAPTVGGAWEIDNFRLLANQSEDLRATDTLNGDWYSASGPNVGMAWEVVDPDLAGIGLTDMQFIDGGMTPDGRGKSSFIWGVSSGLTLAKSGRTGSCSHNGKVWQYSPTTANWTACPTTGLDDCEDFRAVLKVSTGTILAGSRDMGGGSLWAGLYRSDDSCATWVESNYGLPANPQVWALQEVSGGDLLAGLAGGGTDGGVYLSDAQSGGRAWVRYSAGFAPSLAGTVDLTGDGTSVYSGMGDDGVYADADAIPYFSGAPLALFEASPATACVGASVTFADRSAGKPDTWAWNFGDAGTSIIQNPTHAYSMAGTYYPQLTASSFFGSDTYTLDPPGIAVVGELDLGDGLRMAKQAYAVSFRVDAAGFTPTGLWHRTEACSAGSTVFYYGQDGSCTYDTGVPNTGTLTSPAIALAGMTAPVLSFRYRLQTEEYATPGFDIATVWTSPDGSTWTELTSDTANGGTLVIDNAWHIATFDISSFGGGTLYIRFTFNTMDANYNAFLGFMLDDITITDPGALMMTWDDIGDGESGYQVFYSATPASGAANGAEFPACAESPCSGAPYNPTLDPNTAAYYRLRVEGAGYACGDGPVGGSW